MNECRRARWWAAAWVIWFAALSAGATGAEQRRDVPPALVWDSKTGNCPAALDWEGLRGHVVVITFGDDYVLPQDAAEWSEDQQGAEGEPVFLRIVTGPEFLVEHAVKKTGYTGCILFDSGGRNQQNFGIRGLPARAVVDPLGNIRIQEPYASPRVDRLPRNSVPSFTVRISPATPDEPRALGLGGTDEYLSTNQPLKLLILDLWDTPSYSISFPEGMDEASYDVTARIPIPDRELLRRLVREAVENHFRLRIEREVRMRRTYLMTVAGSPGPQLRLARANETPVSGGGEGSMFGIAQSTQEIAQTFEGLLSAPVVDETGYEGRYDYVVSCALAEQKSPPAPSRQDRPIEVAPCALPESETIVDFAHQLGVQLVPVDRPVEVLVVRKD